MPAANTVSASCACGRELTPADALLRERFRAEIVHSRRAAAGLPAAGRLPVQRCARCEMEAYGRTKARLLRIAKRSELRVPHAPQRIRSLLTNYAMESTLDDAARRTAEDSQ